MACAIGTLHTVCLSDDGIVHSFGYNLAGNLGIGNNDEVVEVPNRISILPKIQQISCGSVFTVCIDNQGFLWSFGLNDCGQLGLEDGNTPNVPQRVQDIPLVKAVSCGASFTLIITIDENIWSVGNNKHGQLILGHKISQFKFQQTSCSAVYKISTGDYHSLYQNNLGEIFGCGFNEKGQLGLGHKYSQTQACKIPLHNINVIDFCCGSLYTLFLDIEGNVYSVGYNVHGSLGTGNTTNQILIQANQNIPDIPSIRIISCINASSYLVDIHGDVWGFGLNFDGQLGNGDKKKRNSPTKIQSLNDITQISKGPCGTHVLVKNSQNEIFVVGDNKYGQLGGGFIQSFSKPQKIFNSKYYSMWGEAGKSSRAKSARK